MNNRVFVICNRTCLGAVGGGRGVNYKLYIANKKYKLVPNMIHLFIDKDILFGDNYFYKQAKSKDIKNNKNVINYVKRCLKKLGISDLGFVCVLRHIIMLKKFHTKIKEWNNKWNFTDDDVFLFQDCESAYMFNYLFHFHKTLLIYHQQGSLYSEWCSFTNKKSELYRIYLNNFLSKSFKSVNTVGFPSQGAKESLVNSWPKCNTLLEKLNISIFYNGVTNIENKKNDELLKEYDNNLDNILQNKTIKFITIANLNKAKAVERIPQYLADFKKKGYKFHWIIIGNGVCANEVKCNIEKYGLMNDVYWIKKPIPHEIVMEILKFTDFYILLHRFSIFDYATLEAMSCGNIPILSDLGGNKEVVLDNNGILLDDFTNSDDLIRIIKSGTIKSMKEKNIFIQQNSFSERSSLQLISDWCDSISG